MCQPTGDHISCFQFIYSFMFSTSRPSLGWRWSSRSSLLRPRTHGPPEQQWRGHQELFRGKETFFKMEMTIFTMSLLCYSFSFHILIGPFVRFTPLSSQKTNIIIITYLWTSHRKRVKWRWECIFFSEDVFFSDFNFRYFFLLHLIFFCPLLKYHLSLLLLLLL